MLDSEVLPNCVTQTVEKLSKNCFCVSTSDLESMTYGKFKAILEAKAADIHFENVIEAEEKFWDQLRCGSNKMLYGINIPTTLFGKEAIVWNLDKFTKDESNIHSKPSHRLLKVSAF